MITTQRFMVIKGREEKPLLDSDFWFMLGQIMGKLSREDVKSYLEKKGVDQKKIMDSLMPLAELAYEDRWKK